MLGSTQILVHILFVLFHARLTIRIDSKQAPFDDCRDHQHLKQLPKDMRIDLVEAQ